MTSPNNSKLKTSFDPRVVSRGIYGETTKNLMAVWTNRLGDGILRVPEESICGLFNDIDLYPSKSQIFEMVHCARESSVMGAFRRAASTPSQPEGISDLVDIDGISGDEDCYLTFGEFCVFATELHRLYDQLDMGKNVSPRASVSTCEGVGSSGSGSPICSSISVGSPPDVSRSPKSTSAYDVFLGGSCNPTEWRRDIAIPYLKSESISYYNPQQSNWVPEMIELEHQAKRTSRVLLFVVSKQTRNVASMIEISYLAGTCGIRRVKKERRRRRNLVVITEAYPGPGHVIGDDVVSPGEYQDLMSGITTIQDIVERQNLPVFNSLDLALSCTAKLIREQLSVQDLGPEDSVIPIRHSHLQIGDKLVRLREAFVTLDTSQSGKITPSDVRMAFRIHTRTNLSASDLRTILEAHDDKEGKCDEAASDNICSSRNIHVEKSSFATSNSDADVLIDFDSFCCIVSEFKSHQTDLEAASPNRSNDDFAAFIGSHHSGSYFPVTRSAAVKAEGLCCPRNEPGTGRSVGVKKLWSFFSRKMERVRRFVLRNPTCNTPGKEGFSALTSGTASCQVVANDQVRCQARRGICSQQCLPCDRRESSIRDVYLGGTWEGTNGCDWREREAIPLLKKHGLTFYLPTHAEVKHNGSKYNSNRRRLMPIEAAAIDNSRVLLFVVLGDSRALSEMCEAAYYIGLGRASNFVLCLKQIEEDTPVEDRRQPLSKQALKDYNRGRSYLSDIANREAVPIFESVSEALQCVVNKCSKAAVF